MQISPDIYLTSKQVRARYGDVSDMSLWRWSRDQSLGFPEAIYVNKRRFWRLAELEAWERTRAAVKMEAA